MLKINIQKLILLASLAFCFIFPMLSSVSAQEAGTVTVSPSVINLKGFGGEEINSSFDFINSTSIVQNITLETAPYALSEYGVPVFFNEDNLPIASPISKWISFEEFDSSILANKKENIEFSISVPEEINCGKYYVAISITSRSGMDSSIIPKMTVLVALEVEQSPIDKIKSVISLLDLGNNLEICLLFIGIIVLLFVIILIFKRRRCEGEEDTSNVKKAS